MPVMQWLAPGSFGGAWSMCALALPPLIGCPSSEYSSEEVVRRDEWPR